MQFKKTNRPENMLICCPSASYILTIILHFLCTTQNYFPQSMLNFKRITDKNGGSYGKQK